jgi:hypothetical protein
MVRVEQVLNLLVIFGIPLGLFFSRGKVNNEISYTNEVLLPEDFLLNHVVVRS